MESLNKQTELCTAGALEDWTWLSWGDFKVVMMLHHSASTHPVLLHSPSHPAGESEYSSQQTSLIHAFYNYLLLYLVGIDYSRWLRATLQMEFFLLLPLQHSPVVFLTDTAA